MPPRFVPPAVQRCPRCSKAVYSAEQVIGPMGAAWHKACFTCKECNRRLDSSTLAEHEGEAYCKSCHKKMWGPTGYGYATGVLVPEGPESQFSQSIGRPPNNNSSNLDGTGGTGDSFAVASNITGGSTNSGSGWTNSQQTQPDETEEQRRERLTPVNATLKKRNSLDMIREQAEASRRAYDDAHAQRVANRYGQTVLVNTTGDSATSTGSKGGLGAGPTSANSGYHSGGSDTSSLFGSTIATISSPAPSFSSVSSSTSTSYQQPQQQPATRSLYLNQSIRSTSSSSISSGLHHQQQQQEAESDYLKSRQALSFQTGAPPSSGNSAGGPPSLPKRSVASEPAPEFEHNTKGPSAAFKQTDDDDDENYLEYAPIRIVARKDDSPAATPTITKTTQTFAPSVDEDEWEVEDSAAKKKHEESTAAKLPMFRSQYLAQQDRLTQEDQKQSRTVPPPPPALPTRQESTPPSSTSSARVNTLINETDRLTLREREKRLEEQLQRASDSVQVDEWEEEPTPSVPSRPQNVSYSPARHVSSAATRTWTPTTHTSVDNERSPVSSSTHHNIASTPATTASTTVPKTGYYRSGGVMTPKKPGMFGGGGDICPRCQKTVYHAESALGPGGVKYHKPCLRCVDCSKSLDSSNMADRQGTPYCKTCYGKAFGAKGYGYGSGASMLHTEL